MGPRLLSRGKAACVPKTCRRFRSFNGATTLESWKGTEPQPWPHFVNWASMGPRLLSRGKGIQAPRKSAPAIRFNGATTLESWKGLKSDPMQALDLVLQWGHDS